MVGQVLAERYEIRELLGHGGMGQVWRAYDLKLRVEVALKALVRSGMAEERGRELLRREVRLAREVVSPNVCRIYDLIEVGGREMVSMECIDGVTLLEHLRAHGPLGPQEAGRLAAQLLAVLGGELVGASGDSADTAGELARAQAEQQRPDSGEWIDAVRAAVGWAAATTL